LSVSAINVLYGLSRLGARLIAWVMMWVAFVISHFETRDVVISNERGHNALDPIGPRVVIFSHFDRHARIRTHTRAYIDALSAEGLDVVFVSNAARLTPPDLAWVRERAVRIVIRRNLGYDFAAWRDAMAACGLPATNTSLLLLANDSVYGPLYPLRTVLSRIDFNEADVWGATDSWQHRFHLQSFFLAFGPKAFGHEAFGVFWRSIRNVRSKAWVISRYEMGLSRALIDAGLRCKAIWSYADMIKVLRKTVAEHDNRDRTVKAGSVSQKEPGRENNRLDPENPFAQAGRRNSERLLRVAYRRVPLNPTADLWRVLIEQGFPFLKRELLRDNPSRVPDVATWSSVIDEIHGYNTDIILSDLEKSLKNRTP
jgi:hypothetical protein